MRSLKPFLAFAALVAASSANAAILNGDFENANFTGNWSTYTSNSDDPFFGAHGSIATVPASSVGAPMGTGANVAFLHSGRSEDYQLLWQDFAVSSAGSSLSMLLKWAGNDSIYYDASYNDDGYARIAKLDGMGNPLAWSTIWDASVAEYGNADGPNGGNSGWESAICNFSMVGNYRLEFGIRNVGIGAVGDDDEANASEMFVDNVVLTTPVPEPGALGLIVLGVGALAFRRRRSA